MLRTLDLPASYAKSRPLAIEEITLDPPAPMEGVVKVAGAGFLTIADRRAMIR